MTSLGKLLFGAPLASLLVIVAGQLGATTQQAASAPRFTFDAHELTMSVVGLEQAQVNAVTAQALAAADWRRVLRVVAVDPLTLASGDELPPLLGSYEAAGDALHFRPRFPPASGLVLKAFFDGGHWDALVERAGGPRSGRTADAHAELVVPEDPEATRAEVVAVYPTGAVPANLLRFYVHFSAPMSARHVLPHVRLLDADAQPISEAFVEVEGGLWDRARTRLTLFVHPGRVKRGVGPGEALGPVLEEGHTYSLEIGAEAQDAGGRPLLAAYSVPLTVGPADRTSPDPSRWRLIPPSESTQPLRLELDQPADRALLQRLPTVLTDGGEAVPGRAEVDDTGLRYLFQPEAPWRAGRYRLEIPSALEDYAGNRLDRLFEEKPTDKDVTPLPFYLPFTVPTDG